MFHKILQWLTGDIPRLKRPHTFFEAWIRCKCGACYIPTLCKIYATYPKNMQNICNTPKIAGYLQQTQKYAKYLQHTQKYSNYLQHTKNQLRRDWRIFLQCLKSLTMWPTLCSCFYWNERGDRLIKIAVRIIRMPGIPMKTSFWNVHRTH